MNIIVARNIADKMNLGQRERNVFIELANRSNNDNWCWPGLKKIAEDAKVSVSTVQRALKELIALGLVMKKPNFRENGSQTSNIYILSENLLLLEEVKKENERIQKKIEDRMESLAKKKNLIRKFKALQEHIMEDVNESAFSFAEDKKDKKEQGGSVGIFRNIFRKHKNNIEKCLNYIFSKGGVVKLNSQEPKHILGIKKRKI